MIDQLEKEIHEGMLDLYQHQRMSKERESLVYFYFAGIHNEKITLKEETERLKEDIRVFKFTIKTQQKQIQELIAREDKAIEYIETHQLNFKKNITTFGSERLSMEERKLLDILRGVEKE